MQRTFNQKKLSNSIVQYPFMISLQAVKPDQFLQKPLKSTPIPLPFLVIISNGIGRCHFKLWL